MDIKKNISLKKYTTFRIGGDARYFVEVCSVDELVDAVKFSKENRIPFVVLGGGSNLLISDNGYDGLVIKNLISGIEWVEDEKTVLVTSGAGENWDELVRQTVDKNLFGLENLSLVPGSVGASPIQNIGAYGVEVKRTIERVEVLDTRTLEIKNLTNRECEFGYRDSIFKKEEGSSYVVTKVTFKLQKEGLTFIGYRDLADYFVRIGIAKATPKEVRDAVVEIRTLKLPDVTKVGTAGSFFKNPVITKEKFEKLKETYPDITGHAEDGLIKISAGWMIDKLCNMRGVCVGDACVHDRQALVIVNKGNATKKDVDDLAIKIINAVKEKTNIELEREVRTF